ncbi:hypothetical protein V0M98_17785 [Pseudomonas silesiensis]|uniref:hypothetical protein n=1 Tax=Pseudomonas silesiensis TaxID=1853130 RepID=UPI0030CBF704
MMSAIEMFLFEAVANTGEPDDDGVVSVDWLLEGGADALEGPALLMTVTDGHFGEDWHGGYFVHKADFDRVTAERDALQLRLNAADQRIDDVLAEIATVRLGPCKMIVGDEMP